MCGIIGYSEGGRSPDVADLLQILAHRGPDGRGVWQDAHHTFGHTRLSIIDLVGGSQPMAGIGDRFHITYNGEVYNYQGLRRRLGEEHFRTQSDTEAILALAHTGAPPERWVRQLDGMFAFGLACGKDLLLARDPLGIKPLYLARHGEALVFASEIKALPPGRREVSEFPPGHVYTHKGGLRRYYHMHAGKHDVTEAAHAAGGIRTRLERAVRKRLIADVPVGVFLSGGLDSSLIAALACRYKGDLNTFAIGTADSEDLPVARQVAEFLGTRHRERLYTVEEAIRALPEVIHYLESFDAALVRSAVPNFFLAKLASEYVKVTLAGEGADELFAGYEYLKALDLASLDGELRQITAALHNTNLQRCDRMSMAHGLEVRVPFLDVAVVDYAMRIVPELKQRGPERQEKWILRRMAEDLLPAPVAWRRKEKFAVGSGLGDHLARLADRTISDPEFQRHRRVNDDLILRSKEELYYFRIFREMYPQDDLLPLIGRSRSV